MPISCWGPFRPALVPYKGAWHHPCLAPPFIKMTLLGLVFKIPLGSIRCKTHREMVHDTPKADLGWNMRSFLLKCVGSSVGDHSNGDRMPPSAKPSLEFPRELSTLTH